MQDGTFSTCIGLILSGKHPSVKVWKVEARRENIESNWMNLLSITFKVGQADFSLPAEPGSNSSKLPIRTLDGCCFQSSLQQWLCAFVATKRLQICYSVLKRLQIGAWQDRSARSQSWNLCNPTALQGYLLIWDGRSLEALKDRTSSMIISIFYFIY